MTHPIVQLRKLLASAGSVTGTVQSVSGGMVKVRTPRGVIDVSSGGNALRTGQRVKCSGSTVVAVFAETETTVYHL